jgi:hypothetical protein
MTVPTQQSPMISIGKITIHQATAKGDVDEEEASEEIEEEEGTSTTMKETMKKIIQIILEKITYL